MRFAAAALLVASAFGADDGFARWWPKFQAAAARGDAAAIIENAHFPIPWENGPVREIKSREEFLSRFSKYFTADMKRAIAREKPVRVPEGYMITWHARGNEYSLYFHPERDSFALAGLSEGPP